MELIPLYDKIVVKVEPLEDQTEGGLFIPVEAEDKFKSGRVIAVGIGKMTPEGCYTPLLVKVGDKILCNKYAGTELPDSCVILREDEILGILPK